MSCAGRASGESGSRSSSAASGRGSAAGRVAAAGGGGRCAAWVWWRTWWRCNISSTNLCKIGTPHSSNHQLCRARICTSHQSPWSGELCSSQSPPASCWVRRSLHTLFTAQLTFAPRDDIHPLDRRPQRSLEIAGHDRGHQPLDRILLSPVVGPKRTRMGVYRRRARSGVECRREVHQGVSRNQRRSALRWRKSW